VVGIIVSISDLLNITERSKHESNTDNQHKREQN
jgi:hypothetical protein